MTVEGSLPRRWRGYFFGGECRTRCSAPLATATLLCRLWHEIADVELRFAVPRAAAFGLRSRGQVEVNIYCVVRLQIPENRIVELVHRLQRLHEHARMGDLARREMAQCLARAFVLRKPDQRLIRGERTGLGRDIGTQITHHAGAFVHITRIPGRTLRVHQMRPVAAHGEQRAVERLLLRALFRALGVLLDHQRHHFKMAELLGGDVLQHVADALVLGVEGLGEVGSVPQTVHRSRRRTALAAFRRTPDQAYRRAPDGSGRVDE